MSFYQPVRGCRDVIGKVAESRRGIVSKFAKLCSLHCFSEIETPILDRLGIFSESLGSTSDIISSELFHISTSHSNSASQTVLRPEGTACIARAIRFCGYPSHVPLRLWYVGPMFRHERPQRLRLRQFTQLGAELLHDDSVHADVEIISLARKFLDAIALNTALPKLLLNTLGAKRDRERFNVALQDWLRPRVSQLSEVSRARFESGNCLRIFDSKKSEDIEALENGPLLQEYVCVEERMRFTELRKRLSEEEGMEYTVDDNLVRGLDYYTSTAFEFVSNEDPVRAVCAGGRYADLHGINGVGFAAGLERLEGGSCDAEEKDVVLRELEHGVAVLPVEKDADSAESKIGRLCRRIARDVRMKDIRCVAKMDGGRLGKQISRAIRAGAKAVVVVGEDDVCKGLVKVKLVEEGENRDKFAQHDVRIESVAEFLQSELTSRRCQVEGNVDSKELSKMNCTNL